MQKIVGTVPAANLADASIIDVVNPTVVLADSTGNWIRLGIAVGLGYLLGSR